MSVRITVVALALAASLSGCAGWPASDVLMDPPLIAQSPGDGDLSPQTVTADGYPVPVAPAVAVEGQTAWGEPQTSHDLAGPKAVADTDGPYYLDTGDKLRIFVYGQPNLSRQYIVDHDGKIAVPLIGEVSARGKTTRELQSVIRARLGSEFVKDPQVTVDVQQNRPFFILGEVRNAGQYPYVSGMTVETAIAIAGGYTERASERKFRITRRINGMVEQIEAPGDYVLKPGDTVYVFERFL